MSVHSKAAALTQQQNLSSPTLSSKIRVVEDPNAMDAVNGKPCYFFNIIPVELRNRIYEFAIGDFTIHIGFDMEYEDHLEPKDRVLFRSICTAEDAEEEHINRIKTSHETQQLFDHESRHSECNRSFSRHVLSLLKTCKQIRNEATPIIFKRNIFSFDNTMALDQFLSRLDPIKARSISHIALTVTNQDDGVGGMMPFTRNWSNWLGGKLSSLVCVAEFSGARQNDFDENEESRATLLRRFRGLDIKDVTVVAINAYDDENLDFDEDVVDDWELKAFASEIEKEIKMDWIKENKRRTKEARKVQKLSEDGASGRECRNAEAQEEWKEQENGEGGIG